MVEVSYRYLRTPFADDILRRDQSLNSIVGGVDDHECMLAYHKVVIMLKTAVKMLWKIK